MKHKDSLYSAAGLGIRPREGCEMKRYPVFMKRNGIVYSSPRGV